MCTYCSYGDIATQGALMYTLDCQIVIKSYQHHTKHYKAGTRDVTKYDQWVAVCDGDDVYVCSGSGVQTVAVVRSSPWSCK